MQIHEPRLQSDLSDLQHASSPHDTRFTPMPVKMLGKIATRTFSNVRQLLHKDASQEPTKSAQVTAEENKVKDTINNLKNVVKQSRETLCTANTVILPMNLFPDTVMVDRTRITIIKRSFFWSADVISISIKDVLNVSTSVGPFFGSLTVSSRVMNSTDHFQINYFWRKDAMYLKHIVQGYVIAHQNNIATDQLSRDQLIETLLELGKEGRD